MTCARFKEVSGLRIFRPKGLLVAFVISVLGFVFLIKFAGQDDMLAVGFGLMVRSLLVVFEAVGFWAKLLMRARLAL